MTSIGLVLFGVVVGMFSGVLGIGGGVVLVPGLMLLFGFSQLEAQGTSLTVLSVPVVIFAALVYYQNGFVRLPVVAFIAVGFLVGAFSGAKLVPHIPIDWMRLAFGALLLYVGLVFVLDIRSTRPQAMLPAVVAAAVTAIVARLLRRRLAPHHAPKPPTAEMEYHI